MKIGTRCICVDDTGTAPNYNEIDPNYPAQELVEGLEYVVRFYGPAWLMYEGDYTGIKVEGVVRPDCPVSGVSDPAFRASRFRPVVSGVHKKELEEVV